MRGEYRTMNATVHFPDIDFGIVNFNGGLSLTECVKSMCSMQGVTPHVFVCDNGSKDGSIEQLRKAGFDCRIEETGKNLGYAGACNKLLARMKSPVQVLCNMDLTFDTGWGLRTLEAFARHPGAGSIASLVLETGGKVNATGIRFDKDMSAENENSGEALDTLGELQEKEIFGCYGAVMTFRREAAEKAGPMDASFFLFFEETEWYLRHNLCGLKTILAPAAIVRHERSKTTVRYSPMKLYYAERNRIRSAIRYLPLPRLFALPFASFRRYLRMAKGGIPSKDASGRKHSKIQLAFTLLKAWFAAIQYIPEELRNTAALKRKFGGAYRNHVRQILDAYPKI